MMELPSYYDYNNNAFKAVEAPGGRIRGYLLGRHSGMFEIANSVLRKVLYADSKDDVSEISEEEFVQIAEVTRSSYLRGEGPIFAIYGKIDEWFAQKDSFDAVEWRNKRDFI